MSIKGAVTEAKLVRMLKNTPAVEGVNGRVAAE